MASQERKDFVGAVARDSGAGGGEGTQEKGEDRGEGKRLTLKGGHSISSMESWKFQHAKEILSHKGIPELSRSKKRGKGREKGESPMEAIERKVTNEKKKSRVWPTGNNPGDISQWEGRRRRGLLAEGLEKEGKRDR